MPRPSKLTLGIAAGVATGMLWGIVFLVPQALPNYTSLELSLGRYKSVERLQREIEIFLRSVEPLGPRHRPQPGFILVE